MVSYVRRGWPQTEALKQATREHAIDWKAKPSIKRQRRPEKEAPQIKRQRIGVRTGNHYRGREVCKPHNDIRGCTKRPQDCTNNRHMLRRPEE